MSDGGSRSRGGGVVKFIVVIAILVVLTAGGLFAWKYLAGGPSKSDTIDKTFDESISSIVVEGNSGDVDIVAGVSDKVSVEFGLEWNGDKKPSTSQKVSGDTLNIAATGCGGFDMLGLNKCRNDITIEMPADINVDVRLDSGEITTNKVAGDQKLDCDSGNIEIKESSGNLDLLVDSGEINGTKLDAKKVTADADSGNIDLAFDNGPEKVTTHADSGNVDLAFEAAPGRVGVTADSGDATVSVPEVDEGYKVTSTVDSGDKKVDVAVKKSSSHEIDGNIDSGDLTINYS